LIQRGAGKEHQHELLSSAALSSNPQVTLYLLEKFGKNLDIPNNDGATALIQLSKSNTRSLECAQLLLQYKLHINTVDKHNRTALHYAAERGDLKLISLLMENGIDVLITDIDGKRAHQVASHAGQHLAHDLIKNSNESLQEHPPSMLSWSGVHDCPLCHTHFGLLHRKHHCHHCGGVFCSKCAQHEIPIPKFHYPNPVSVCTTCFNFLVK